MSPGLFSSLSSIQRRIPSGVLIAAFGLLLTAAAWFDVLHRQSADRAAEIERIHRENGSLARAFEEHVRRVIQSADNALLFLQHEFEESGQVTGEIADFVERTRGDVILNQITVADARGDLLLSAVRTANLSTSRTGSTSRCTPRAAPWGCTSASPSSPRLPAPGRSS